MKMRNVLAPLIFIAVMGCTREALIEDKYVTLGYEQTQCADPWPSAGTDSLTLKNVATYLNASGLYVSGLSIKQVATGFFCAACTCTTGKVIYVITLDDALIKAKYREIGFK